MTFVPKPGVVAVFYIGSAIGVVSGITVLMAGIMVFISAPMNPSRVKKFGIVAIVFSLVGLFDGGGFGIGLVFGMIGGILAVRYKG